MAVKRTSLVMTAALAVVVAGCAQPSSSSTAEQATVQRIKHDVAALPHVATVTADYGDQPSATGSLLLTAIVEPGAYPRLQAVVDRVEQIVWQSSLQPLTSMQVVVQDTSYRHEERVYVLDRDPTWRQLEQRYGPRSSG